MTISFIPCGGGKELLPDVTYRIRLEDKEYDFRFRYLQRESNVASVNKGVADDWYLYLGLTGKEPFLKTSLRTNRELLQLSRSNPDCPKGDLILKDSVAVSSVFTGGAYNPERVTFEGLGTDKRFKLVYWSEDQI